MSEKIEQQYPVELSQVYGQLKQQDVEQFYTGYQWWKIQQRVIALQAEIGTLRQQINENAQYMQEVRPPAVALATLARLQANGVHDLELLDRMLERGEGWLDLIVQRLDYCEQLEFIPDNYTQWCEHALEGAYDWIDSMRGADALAPSEAPSDIVDLVSVEATEELLLRKLTSEEEEEEEVADEQETKFQDGDFAPPLEIQLPTAANAEADLSQDIQAEHVHPLDETSYAENKPQELLQQEMEIPLPIETAAIDDSSFVTEEQHFALDSPLSEEVEAEASPSTISTEQQVVESALVLDVVLSIQVDVADNALVVSDDQDTNQQIVEPVSPIPMEADAEINPTTVPIEQDSEQRAAEPAPIPEDSLFFEGNAEADSAQVPIDQAASPEDTSVSVTQETPLPIGADYEFSQVILCHPERSEGSLATGTEMLRYAQHDRTSFGRESLSSAASDELHNEQVAETAPVAEVSLPVETNAGIASPVEADPEAVHTAERSISQQEIESAPAQHVKPRGFWRWLLALFRI